MSDANEALVREAVQAFYQGDTVRLLKLVHQDLEWTYLNPAEPDPKPEVCHGRHQIAWALGQVMVVARTPGLDEQRAWRNGDRNILVLTVRDGQIVAMRAFRDRDQASQFSGLT